MVRGLYRVSNDDASAEWTLPILVGEIPGDGLLMRRQKLIHRNHNCTDLLWWPGFIIVKDLNLEELILLQVVVDVE